MRITTRIEGPLAEGGAAARLQERMRWAFGTYASQIQRVTLRASVDPELRATVLVRLRSAETVELSADGSSLDEVVEFLLGRARSAVARRLAAEPLGAG
ncbi:MAG: hypothetical protein R3B82_12060 [Sandaracinaceae bacterium]